MNTTMNLSATTRTALSTNPQPTSTTVERSTSKMTLYSTSLGPLLGRRTILPVRVARITCLIVMNTKTPQAGPAAVAMNTVVPALGTTAVPVNTRMTSKFRMNTVVGATTQPVVSTLMMNTVSAPTQPVADHHLAPVITAAAAAQAAITMTTMPLEPNPAAPDAAATTRNLAKRTPPPLVGAASTIQRMREATPPRATPLLDPPAQRATTRTLTHPPHPTPRPPPVQRATTTPPPPHAPEEGIITAAHPITAQTQMT